MPFGPEILAGLVKILDEVVEAHEIRGDEQAEVVGALLSHVKFRPPARIWPLRPLRSLVKQLNDKLLMMREVS